MIRKSISIALAALSCSVATNSVHAQTCNELIQFVHSSSGSAVPEHFGTSVDIDGDYGVVGAWGAGPGGLGQAYVYFRSSGGWGLQQALIPSGGSPATFGEAIAISGDTVVVGAPLAGGSNQPGAAYVFVRSGTSWTQQAILTGGPFQQNFGGFGTDVAIDGNTILVGAPFYQAATATLGGQCFAFTRTGTTWGNQTQIIASTFQTGAEFGDSVALRGGTAIIGAAHYNSGTGTAYMFSYSGSTWTQQQQINPTGGSGSFFGISVDLRGTTAAVGAMHDSTLASSAGAAYVFENSGGTWSQQAKLTRNGGVADDQLGTSVAVGTDEVVVGMQPYTGVNPTPGSAYQFLRSGTTWFQGYTIVPVTNQNAAAFGAVALSGDNLIVGAPNYDSGSFTDIGTAYMFGLAGSPFGYCVSGAPCGDNYPIGGCINNLTTNVGARLLGCGSASVSADNLHLDGTQLPSGTLCILVLSGNSQSPVQNGNGLLVLANPVTRGGNNNASGTTISYGPGLLSSFAGSGLITSGQTTNWQIWYRNPAVGCSPANTNWSNGYQVTLTP